QISNGSSIKQFLHLAFTDTWEMQLSNFWLFLGIYLAPLPDNGLIITTIAYDHHLHTPCTYSSTISITGPKSMADSLWDTRAISYLGRAVQVFLFVFFFCLLTVMAYNRCVAICKPLHYRTLLGRRACVHMARAAWPVVVS
ncbi:Olfactory receptor 14I1, partial [Eudyptula minor novaehollandiae]